MNTYAKALVPGDGLVPDVPLLVVAMKVESGLVPILHRTGWEPYGGRAVAATNGMLTVGKLLRLTVNGVDLIDDPTDTVEPVGWSQAVVALEDQVAVLIIQPGEVELSSEHIGEQIAGLSGSRQTAHAVVPVQHA